MICYTIDSAIVYEFNVIQFYHQKLLSKGECY